MDESEIYNVENYTERDLFAILDINNPTDRELETSILKNVRQYEKDREENPKSAKLWRFFNDMYKRFFDVDEESSDEESGIEGFAYESPNFTFSPVVNATKDGSIKNKITGATNSVSQSLQNINSLGASQQQMNDIASQQITLRNNDGNELRGNIDTKQLRSATTTTTHNVEYVKDNLNPIKRETMFKMISIDSQFRDDARTTGATNFTMNLSSSIENVISIKLYSIQIPYTWYMVNDGFGSNFFYIKGHSPGINNGNHDVQIMIDSGNYTQAELMSAINNSLFNLSNNPDYILDVSFGKTQAFYNSTNAKVRIAVDFKKTFTDVDYQLYFPNWTSPNVTGAAKNDSLASFLGYNFENYYINTVYGNRNSFLGNTFADESTVANYKLITGINDYFSVIQYVGPNTYVPGTSALLKQVDVHFSSALTNGTKYSRDQLYSNLKTQIAANAFFDPGYSDIRLETVPVTETVYEWHGYNHYELSVKLNRKKTVNLPDTKIVVKFPGEMEDAGNGFYGNNFIWTGAQSCFRFDNSYNEISEIVSETETLFTNYIVGGNDYVRFNCTKLLFNVPENNYSAKVDPSTADGYLLDVYTQKINDALTTMNAATVTFTKPDGVFGINDVENIRNTYFDVINAIPTFQIDISKTFDQSTYIIDLTECFFSKDPFNFSNTISNLTNSNYTIANTFDFVASYTIGAFEQIVLYPKTTGGLYGNGYGNQNQSTVTIMLNPDGNEFNGSFEQLSTHLKNVFEAIVDPETGENILSNVELLSQINADDTNKIDVSLNFIISKNLKENDYQMVFQTDSIGSSNPWAKLNFGVSYNLSQYENVITNFAVVQGNAEVYQNTIEIRENYNQFQLIPYYDGVYDLDGLNNITITIPTSTSIGSNYTRDQLFAEINMQLSANPLMQNSEISLFNIGQKQYSKIRININKTYLPKDYRLVFYDPISFSYCGVGTTGGRSIRTITWESTLGWLMGFHSFTEYTLEDFTTINSQNINDQNYIYNLYTTDSGAPDPYLYSYQSTTGKISVLGDSILNTNLYNYFLIILDDYIQNHVNDGLVTITSLEKDVALPTYASRVTYQCDPVSGKKVAVSASNRENMNLSSKQLYAMNQVLEARRTKEKSYSAGPVMRDVFALVPLKLSGLAFGSTYMEFGGTLQNQDRKYFGPVRIQKLSVKLMNDKGDVVNLNGGNWSFTIICEIMVANK
jgi:hypothetical protein